MTSHLRRRASVFLGLVLLAGATAATDSARGDGLLAYSNDGAIYTANASSGKDAKRICVGDDPCISNDGRFLVYTHTNRPAAKPKRHPDTDDSLFTRSLVLRELSNGNEALLPSGGAPQVYGALWSPDDEWIAFNAYVGQRWRVAVVHPDGSALHVVTDKLGAKDEGYYLAGWNLHDKAVLAQNLDAMAQLDPATGAASWQRPVKELTGEDSASSGLRCTISADGKFLVSTRYVEKDEFNNLDGPSSYLVLADFPVGTARRITPPKFDASTPWLDSSGENIWLRGFVEKDITTVKHSDGFKLRMRIYRYEIRSGKLTPLVEGGDSPSVGHR